METYFRILTWGIPWTEKPGRLKSTGTQRVGHKGNQSWMFIGRTDAEVSILWLLDVKSRLIGKDPDAGKDQGQEEKRATKDQMVGWHH